MDDAPLAWQNVPARSVLPKLYVSGFPKAGLHLLELMVRPLVKPAIFGPGGGATWVSSHVGVWTAQWAEAEALCWQWSLILPGTYLKGHCAYRQDLAEFMRLAGLSHVFIYRDLRDVAVSATYHVLNPDPSLIHPGKGTFKYMDFDQTLEAIITGLGPFLGIGERWAMYQPWLEQEWVYSVKYEDAITEPEKIAAEILEYGIDRTCTARSAEVRLGKKAVKNLVDKMAKSSQNTAASPTFRKGGHGGWKDHFTDEHKRLFKKHAGKWLIKLGYEQNKDW